MGVNENHPMHVLIEEHAETKGKSMLYTRNVAIAQNASLLYSMHHVLIYLETGVSGRFHAISHENIGQAYAAVILIHAKNSTFKQLIDIVLCEQIDLFVHFIEQSENRLKLLVIYLDQTPFRLLAFAFLQDAI